MAQKETPKLLYEGKGNPKQFMRVYEWHGRKFRIRCEHTNGSCLDFNSKCCLAVMTDSGNWVNIEDSHSLGIRWYNCCVYNADDPRIDKVNKEAEKAFLEYIKSVY